MDFDLFADTIVSAVRDHVERATAPILATVADLQAKNAELQAALDAIPEGKNGVDGLGFDDMAAEYDGERTITLRFQRDETVKEFSFDMPVVLDRGVWREGEYKAGDAVTWAGSLWIAQKATQNKPEGGSDWRLAIKRGRDGKDVR